jgi:hypothetical protein
MWASCGRGDRVGRAIRVSDANVGSVDVMDVGTPSGLGASTSISGSVCSSPGPDPLISGAFRL